MKNRKTFTRSLVQHLSIVISACLLLACGSDGSSSGSQPPPVQPPPVQPPPQNAAPSVEYKEN